MEQRIAELTRFLNTSHSSYHAVAALTAELEAAGYTCLSEGESWVLTPGGKYYLTRGGCALTAFRIPQGTPRGFLLSASHSDRPTFKLKENGELTGKYTRVATEKYGGMLIAPWLDRPLSVAGRVLTETEKGTESRLVDIDRDLLLIPNVAIHMNRKAERARRENCGKKSKRSSAERSWAMTCICMSASRPPSGAWIRNIFPRRDWMTLLVLGAACKAS